MWTSSRHSSQIDSKCSKLQPILRGAHRFNIDRKPDQDGSDEIQKGK